MKTVADAVNIVIPEARSSVEQYSAAALRWGIFASETAGNARTMALFALLSERMRDGKMLTLDALLNAFLFGLGVGIEMERPE